MKIIVDSEASNYILEILHFYLQSKGLNGLDVVNLILKNTETRDDIETKDDKKEDKNNTKKAT